MEWNEKPRKKLQSQKKEIIMWEVVEEDALVCTCLLNVDVKKQQSGTNEPDKIL